MRVLNYLCYRRITLTVVQRRVLAVSITRCAHCTRSFSTTDTNSNSFWEECSILYTVYSRERNGKKIHYTKGKRSLSKVLLTHISTSCLDEQHSNISPPPVSLSSQKGVIRKVVRLLVLLDRMSWESRFLTFCFNVSWQIHNTQEAVYYLALSSALYCSMCWLSLSLWLSLPLSLVFSW